jgi:hypothetical protein
VTTALSADAFSLGERLLVTVIARNISSEVRQIHSVCAPMYLVLRPIGTPSTQPGRACIMIFIPPKDIAPGDSVVIHDSWDGSLWNDSRGTVAAPPGVYLIEGRVFTPEEVRGSARPVLLK